MNLPNTGLEIDNQGNCVTCKVPVVIGKTTKSNHSQPGTILVERICPSCGSLRIDVEDNPTGEIVPADFLDTPTGPPLE